MNFESSLKEAIMSGDYRNEAEDEYVKMIESDTKKTMALRIGIGAFYISVLILSLFIV